MHLANSVSADAACRFGRRYLCAEKAFEREMVYVIEKVGEKLECLAFILD
jgi:hypothetical protein